MTIQRCWPILPREVEYHAGKQRIRSKEMARICAVLCATLLLAACGAAPVAVAPRPDVRVPASVPRRTLAFVVDLEPGADCEQAFDLALYRNRGVDLIEWDSHTGECRQRRVRVRYLPERIDARAVGALVHAHSRKAQELRK